jgi:hypothetical protein
VAGGLLFTVVRWICRSDRGADTKGVFDFSGRLRRCAWLWPAMTRCSWQHLLFDSNVSNESGQMRIVFDLNHV